MTLICPEDSTHFSIDPWWVETTDNTPAPGRLLWVYVPHVGQEPKALVPTGRTGEVRQHELADCEILPATHEKVFTRSTLPVASLPCYDNELLSVYNAKRRPVLVLAAPHIHLDKDEFKGKPPYMTASTYMVAPYYGADEGSGTRAGYPQTFMDRVRHCEYPQFVWDMLPLPGANVSLLRLDQIYPLSTMFRAYETTPYMLSGEALTVVQEWMGWHFFGEVPKEGFITFFQDMFKSNAK
jgi:hypothetical protein